MDVDCSVSSLDLFDTQLIQRDVIDGYYKEVQPVNSLQGGNVVEFRIPGEGKAFTDLRHCYLKMRIGVKKANGHNLDPAADKVSLINYIGATLFSQIDISLNGTQISSSTNHALRSIIDVMMNYGREAKEGQLQAALFYKDTAGQMDTSETEPADPATPVNQGLKSRWEWVKSNNSIELIARIHSDIFLQPKMLVNGVEMQLKFHKNKDSFSLISRVANAAYKIVLEDISLMLRKCILTDTKYNQLQSVSKRDIVYPITQVLTKVFTYSAGPSSLNINNAVQGKIPNRMIIGLVSNAAYNGDYTKNPFNFQHFGLRGVAVKLDGNTVNGDAIKVNFDDNRYMEGFWTLFASTGYMFKDDGCYIDREDYKSGYTLFAYDLTPTLCDGQYVDPEKSGDLAVELTFKAALAEAVTVCMYFEYNSMITINAARQVTAHFNI